MIVKRQRFFSVHPHKFIKMGKIFYWTIGFVAFILIVSIVGITYFNNMWFKDKPNYLADNSLSQLTHFEWSKGKYGDYIELHDIIKIPVKIKGVTQKLYMQFDTGAPSTVILDRPIESLMEKGLPLKEMTAEEQIFIKGLEFHVGENRIDTEKIKVFSNYGRHIDFSDTTSSYKLGTLGADILDNKITVIDFNKNTIQQFSERPQWMNELPKFQPFSFKGRRLMLPVKIKNKTRSLFYDSGTSAFGLITSKKRYKKYTDKNVEEIRIDANSWGNSLPICHKPCKTPINIGSVDLPLKRISYMDKYTFLQNLMAPFSKIGGWLGNKPFVGHTLILDTQKEEFLVVKKRDA